VFCVVSVAVMGSLGLEVLLDSLGASSDSKVWDIAGKGLPGVSLVCAGTGELRLVTVWLLSGSRWHCEVSSV